MLIVMENRNIHKTLKLLLHVEAIRCFDVFKVNSTKGWTEQFDAVNKLIRILSIYANIYRFDTSKLVEKHGLALHDRFTSDGAEVAEAPSRPRWPRRPRPQCCRGS